MQELILLWKIAALIMATIDIQYMVSLCHGYNLQFFGKNRFFFAPYVVGSYEKKGIFLPMLAEKGERFVGNLIKSAGDCK